MKKLIFLLLLGNPFFTFSQNKNSLLWGISGNGISKSSYIFGTIHYICENDLVISSNLKSIIPKVENVYLEIDFNEEYNDFKNHYNAFNHSGKQLKQYFTEEEYATLEKKFNRKFWKYNLTLAQFSNYKPHEILSVIQPKVVICKASSYEAAISKLAKREGKPIKGIESFEEHNVFQIEDDSVLRAKAHRFYEIITQKDDLGEEIAEFQKLTTIYKSQDIEQIYNYGLENSKNINILKGVEYRNKLWISRIADYSKKQQNLFAVGAGHLGGENGLIVLLQKAGYTLIPMDN